MQDVIEGPRAFAPPLLATSVIAKVNIIDPSSGKKS
jgi:hypothetical protein